MADKLLRVKEALRAAGYKVERQFTFAEGDILSVAPFIRGRGKQCKIALDGDELAFVNASSEIRAIAETSTAALTKSG